MVKLRSKKVIIIFILIILSIVAGLVISGVFKDSKEDKASEAQTTDSKVQSKDAISKDPAPSQQLTAPEAKLPDTCLKISEAVKQTIGDGSKASGNSASTNNNSKITECNYSKDTQLVNVKVYEYKTESDAKADLSKVQIKGFAGQSKGKYNVVASLVTAAANTSSVNTAAATQIVKLAAEKL